MKPESSPDGPELALSICIPTYNRAGFIGETIESILPQLDETTEVVVVDGASSDETPEVMAGLQRRSDRIRYFRQAVNGGFDRDCMRAVELAAGRYCWLFSDDDAFCPDAVARVRPHLGAGHSLIVANAEVRSFDFSRLLARSRTDFREDRLYRVGEDDRLLADTGFLLSFIGAVVIDRALWLARPKEPYIGCGFIHFGVIFQAPLPSSALALGRPLTKIRYGNALWTPSAFDFWIVRWPALVWSMPRSRRAKRRVVPRERWRRPLMLLGLRAMGAYSLVEYRRFIEPRNPARIYAWVARAIARLPGRVVNACGRLLAGAIGALVPGRMRILAVDFANSPFATRMPRRGE